MNLECLHEQFVLSFATIIFICSKAHENDPDAYILSITVGDYVYAYRCVSGLDKNYCGRDDHIYQVIITVRLTVLAGLGASTAIKKGNCINLTNMEFI